MEKAKEKMCATGAGPCSSGCWCGKCIGWKLLKLFLCLAVAFFVFICGVGAGVKMSYYKTGAWGNGGLSMMKCDDAGKCGRSDVMMKGFSSQGAVFGFTADSHAVRLFGNITKIEGNKITVLDNSAKEQVVLSQPSTIIMETENEIGFSSLEPGMNIVSVGAMNAGNQMLAKTILVQ
jgi:hypothetical protein